jgi:molybdopterin/thiamine biosynthesis adenylyltransferase
MKRYDRNILIKKVGVEGQTKLLNTKVLVAGTGGLGSSVISSLASMGIGKIGLVDYDFVEISNLNRQFVHQYQNIGKEKVLSAKEWINNYNPDIKVDTYNIKLDEANYNDILHDYDIVVDCFDSFESKFILNKVCLLSNKILIHGGVTEFSGQVMTIIPHKSACLGCLFSETDSFQDIIKGIVAPTVGVIGSLQAMEVLKVILNFDNILINSFLSYDGINQKFQKVNINRNPNCSVCKNNG